MRLWSPPHDAPHLLEWWRPLLLASERARADQVPWPIYLDQFRLAGRVIRQGRPDVWIYEHHENRGPLYIDALGETYKFTPTPRAAGPGQFRKCEVRIAVWRAGLPDVVEPVWYDHERLPTRWDSGCTCWQNDQDHDPDVVAAQPGAGPEVSPPRVTRGHLSLIDGSTP